MPYDGPYLFIKLVNFLPIKFTSLLKKHTLHNRFILLKSQIETAGYVEFCNKVNNRINNEIRASNRSFIVGIGLN